MPNPNVIAEFRDPEHHLHAIVCRVTPCPATSDCGVELQLRNTQYNELLGATYFKDPADALAYARTLAGDPPL